MAHTMNVVILYIHTKVLWLFGTFDSLKDILISFSGGTYPLDIDVFTDCCALTNKKFLFYVLFSLQLGRISKQALQNSARAYL